MGLRTITAGVEDDKFGAAQIALDGGEQIAHRGFDRRIAAIGLAARLLGQARQPVALARGKRHGQPFLGEAPDQCCTQTGADTDNDGNGFARSRHGSDSFVR